MNRTLRITLAVTALASLAGPAVAEAQVAVAELQGPRRGAERVRQGLAARLQRAGLEVVPNASVEGEDPQAIAGATGAKAIVIGRVRRRGGRWRAALTIHDAAGEERGSARGSARGVGGLAAQLARRMEDDLRSVATGGAEAEPPPPAGERSRIVVGDFTGRGGARIRNQLVRSLGRDYELVPRSDLDAELERQGGAASDPETLRAAAGVLGIRALIEGHVSRVGRRWTLRVKVIDAFDGTEVGAETFRGRTSGHLSRAVRSGGARRLAGPIGRTNVPTPPEPEEALEEPDVVAEGPEVGSPVPTAPTPRDRSDRPPAIDLAIYGRVFHRALEYNDDHYGLLRGYTLRLGPAIELAGRWYPGAHFTDGFAANIGVEASYERAFGIDSVPANPDDDRVFPTRSQEWILGLRGRIPYQQHFFSLGVGYGHHFFVIEPSGPAVVGRGNLPEIPRTEYEFLRIHAEARLAVAGGFRVTVGGGYRAVFSAGGIQDEVWFPGADVGGVEMDVMLGYLLDNGLEIRLGFDWRRYFYSMNVDLTSPWIAGGAIDQYLGASLGLALRL